MKREHIAFIIGIVGLIGAIIGLILDPRAALTAWLAAAVGWGEVPIGCLAILMMVVLVPGTWRGLFAGPLAAGAALLPVAALSFVPVLIGLWWIYPWADPAVAATLPAFKSVWLSPVFFIIRTIIGFAVFIGLQRGLLATTGETRSGIAAVGLILYALLASWLGVDWAESINPEFHSSIYGLIILAGEWLAGLGLALLIAAPAADEKGLRAAAGVLITALLFWGYIQAMQYIVIWSGDIPLEARWYLRRTTHGWAIITWAIVALQGVVPFLALLSPAVRTSRRALVALAVLMLAMRLVEAAWLVLPPTGISALGGAALWIASLAAIGGLGTAVLLRLLARQGAPAWRLEKEQA